MHPRSGPGRGSGGLVVFSLDRVKGSRGEGLESLLAK